MQRLNRQVVIIGCGHSGTRFTAKAILALNIAVGFEQRGEDGVVGWTVTHVPRSEYEYIGLSRNAVILHQVRHPLMMVSSAIHFGDTTWERIGKYARDAALGWWPLDDDFPLRSMRYCLLWNRMAEERAEFRYRIEDIDNAWASIMAMIGMPIETPMPDIDRHENRHPERVILSWDDLSEADEPTAIELMRMAEHYGYPPDIRDMAIYREPFYMDSLSESYKERVESGIEVEQG